MVDTGVKDGDVVAIWGAGPIGQMAAEFAFMNGAKRVIIIDNNWRLDYVKEKYPKVETVDYTKLKGTKPVVEKMKEMCDGEGPDVALECVAGEYPKGWVHTFELMAGLETDTSEILNECIESVKNYGRVGITGVYVGYTNHFNIGMQIEAYWLFDYADAFKVQSWNAASVSLVTARHQCIFTGKICSRRSNPARSIHSRWLRIVVKWRTWRKCTTSSRRKSKSSIDSTFRTERANGSRDGMQKVFVQTRFSAPPCEGSPKLTEY